MPVCKELALVFSSNSVKASSIWIHHGYITLSILIEIISKLYGFLHAISFSSVQLLSHVRPFATPWTATHQASLSITNSRSLLKRMSIKLVMPSNYLVLCRPLPLQPSIFPRIRVFFNESVLHIRCPKHWSFSFSIIPSNEYSGLIFFRTDCCICLLNSHQSKKLSIYTH